MSSRCQRFSRKFARCWTAYNCYSLETSLCEDEHSSVIRPLFKVPSQLVEVKVMTTRRLNRLSCHCIIWFSDKEIVLLVVISDEKLLWRSHIQEKRQKMKVLTKQESDRGKMGHYTRVNDVDIQNNHISQVTYEAIFNGARTFLKMVCAMMDSLQPLFLRGICFVRITRA